MGGNRAEGALPAADALRFRPSLKARLTKLLKRAAIAIGAVLFLLSLLCLSFSPTVAVQSRPSAKDLHAARQVWRQLKLGRGETSQVRVDSRMIAGLSALARDGSGFQRIEARLADGELRGRASQRLPLGLWLNASASVTGRHSGFPSFRLTVGRLTLPAAAGRPLASLVRRILRMRGAQIPPLDEVVESFSVERAHLLARVRLPTRTGLVDGMIAARSAAIDQELVEAIYCRIVTEQQAEPVGTLSELLRRTFAESPGNSPERYNRASFVALSLAVVGDRAERLLPRGAEMRRRCAFPDARVRLQERADLAKHWIFSAALTSVFGAEAAGNLGEWKELDDSLPDGSGFSFVDLAADRAGVQTALLALEPQTARATHRALGRATDDDLLPELLLEGPEGLSDASFIERYGNLEERDYREAVARIDTLLALQRQTPPN